MCVLSIVTTDALVLEHQAISIQSADWIFFILDQFHTEMLRSLGTTSENKLHFEKLSSYLRGGELKWIHDDVIKWKHFPHYWPFVQGIQGSPVNSPHKGQWRGALMFSLICVWINGWGNNREAGDLRRYHAHYDVTVMLPSVIQYSCSPFSPW